jgi:TolB-like protein
MINHQSPYGQIIKIDTNDYYTFSDEEIKIIEEKYAGSNAPVIYFSKSCISSDSDEEILSDGITDDYINREYYD